MEKLWELLSVAVFAGIGGWCGAYLKVKAENFATREDTNKIVEHLSAVTEATKGIEAKISNDVWDRQKRWELKREICLEAARKWAEAEEALLRMRTITETAEKSGEPESPAWLETKTEAYDKALSASNSFDAAMFLVSLVCGDQLKEAGKGLGHLLCFIQCEVVA